MRRRQIGLQLDRAPIARDCRLELLLLRERIAEMKVSLEIVRLGGDRPTQAISSLCQPVRPLEHRPEIVMRHSETGVELGGFAQTRDGLVQPSEAGKRYPEIAVRLLGGGIEPDRLVQDLDRLLVIAALNRGDAEEMMCAGMQGVTGDRFLCGC